MFHPVLSLRAVVWAWQAALRQIIRPRIWVPFLVIALVETLVLLALANAFDSRVISITLPYIKWVGGEAATHYPFYFYYLPALYARADYVVYVIVASLATGVATLLFSRAYGRPHGGSTWHHVLRRFPSLFVVSAVLIVAIVAVFQVLGGFTAKALISGDPKVRWGARGLEVLLIVLVQSLLAYSTAWIVLKEKGFLGALKNSVSLSLRLFLPTVLIVGLPLVILFPGRYLMDRVDLFLTKFRPESLIWVLQGQILGEMILGFVVVGSITSLFLSQTDETR